MGGGGRWGWVNEDVPNNSPGSSLTQSGRGGVERDPDSHVRETSAKTGLPRVVPLWKSTKVVSKDPSNLDLGRSVPTTRVGYRRVFTTT